MARMTAAMAMMMVVAMQTGDEEAAGSTSGSLEAVRLGGAV